MLYSLYKSGIDCGQIKGKHYPLQRFKKAHIIMGKLERPRLTRAWAYEEDRFGEQKSLMISFQPLFFICALLKIQDSTFWERESIGLVLVLMVTPPGYVGHAMEDG